MDDTTPDPEATPTTKRRRAYRSPTITDFGDVEKLTQGVSAYIP